MVLSRNAIKAEMDTGRLTISPLNEWQIGVSSIDLTLSDNLLVLPIPEEAGAIVEPAKSDFRVMSMLEERGKPRSIVASDPYIINPGELVIGWTKEYITLPTGLAARVEGKSSLARLGLSAHITAPTVIAGYKGTLCLEILNGGPFRIQLVEGMQIAQLILERVELPTREGYSGQFQDQS